MRYCGRERKDGGECRREGKERRAASEPQVSHDCRDVLFRDDEYRVCPAAHGLHDVDAVPAEERVQIGDHAWRRLHLPRRAQGDHGESLGDLDDILLEEPSHLAEEFLGHDDSEGINPLYSIERLRLLPELALELDEVVHIDFLVDDDDRYLILYLELALPQDAEYPLLPRSILPELRSIPAAGDEDGLHARLLADAQLCRDPPGEPRVVDDAFLEAVPDA